jgi:hypothetical protein
MVADDQLAFDTDLHANRLQQLRMGYKSVFFHQTV